MARWPKPPEGSWTEHYKLSTAPVPHEDSISPEFYELEAEAVFKRAWLNVGRVDHLPRNGSYFTKEIEVAKTSVVIVRDMGGEVRAFYNICRHRGNKLVWNDFPKEETAGVCRQFTCKYHGWRYNLDGALNFVQQEGEFFDFDKDDYGLVPVHCDVWEGFIFINLAEEPEQSLTEFLGPMILGFEGYPFDKMTERWFYRSEIKSNWKLFSDNTAGVLPRTRPARRADAAGVRRTQPRRRLRGAATTRSTGRTGWRRPGASGRGRCRTGCSNRWRRPSRPACGARGSPTTSARCRPGSTRGDWSGGVTSPTSCGRTW